MYNNADKTVVLLVQLFDIMLAEVRRFECKLGDQWHDVGSQYAYYISFRRLCDAVTIVTNCDTVVGELNFLSLVSTFHPRVD